MAGPTGPTNEKVGHNESSGTSRPELRYLAIGKIIRAHGLRGEVSVTILTEFPERFDTTEWVYIGNEYEAIAYRLISYRWHQDNVLLTLDGVTDRTQAEALRGQFVQIPIAEAVVLPEGSYYLYQLIGLKVQTTSGEFLGTISNILETGANDVYIVEHDGREVLLPAIPEVIKSIDLQQGLMVIEVISGLI